MGVEAAQILFGKVMHARIIPKRNAFQYGIYYIALSLNNMDSLPIPRNRFAPLSFYDKDHGHRDGSNLKGWAHDILAAYRLPAYDDITLICMPRIFGYVFNPVSFYLCRDEEGHIRAILCEVHNTFGEQHTYLCAHPDSRPITANETLKAQKIFHVSPFLKREGHYNFRFDITQNTFNAAIDFYNGESEKQLITTLSGHFESMNKAALRKAIWRYPLITVKAITLIHWQALKLLAKGIKYIAKPKQILPRHAATDSLTKK